MCVYIYIYTIVIKILIITIIMIMMMIIMIIVVIVILISILILIVIVITIVINIMKIAMNRIVINIIIHDYMMQVGDEPSVQSVQLFLSEVRRLICKRFGAQKGLTRFLGFSFFCFTFRRNHSLAMGKATQSIGLLRKMVFT